MKLILFNMSNYVDWESGVVNRNFFIVKELLKRSEFDEVLLVDFLATQSHKKLFGKKRTWNYAKQVFSEQNIVQKLSWSHHIKELQDDKFSIKGKKVYLLQGLGIATSYKKVFSQLQSFLDEHNFTKDNTLLWSYNAFLPQSLDLPAKVKVFDTVDNWSDHASYKKEAELLKNNYQLINSKADKIFTVSEGLLSLYSNDHVKWVPNAVDLDNFNHQRVEESLNQYSKPLVGYIGTIQERIDFDLVKYLCGVHKDKQFIFYGPVWSGVEGKVKKLKEECSNIVFLGRLPYEKYGDVCNKLDITIIPHKLDAFLKSTNPMKMYDYLAGGKAIVTTPGAGTEMFADLISICDSKESFSDAIDKELSQDSEEKQNQRKLAVSSHSWSNRVQNMMNHLNLDLQG